MTLTLNPNEFIQLFDISVYNNNFYRHQYLGYVINEVCHEDHGFYEYFLLEDGKGIFLGCSDDSSGNFGMITPFEIDFRTYYT